MNTVHYWTGIARPGIDPVRHAVDGPLYVGLTYSAVCGAKVSVDATGSHWHATDVRVCALCKRIVKVRHLHELQAKRLEPRK